MTGMSTGEKVRIICEYALLQANDEQDPGEACGIILEAAIDVKLLAQDQPFQGPADKAAANDWLAKLQSAFNTYRQRTCVDEPVLTPRCGR